MPLTVCGVVLVAGRCSLALDVAHGVDAPRGAVDLALVEGHGSPRSGPSSSSRRTRPITIPMRTTNGNAMRASTQPRLEGGLAVGHGSGGRTRTSNNRLQRPAFCQLNYPRSGTAQVTAVVVRASRSHFADDAITLDSGTGERDQLRQDHQRAARARPWADGGHLRATSRPGGRGPDPDALVQPDRTLALPTGAPVAWLPSWVH